MCRWKKRKTSDTIQVQSINTLTPTHATSMKNEKLKDLEFVINEVISQLNAHFDFKVKTSEETLQNIYALVFEISKKYNIENNI